MEEYVTSKAREDCNALVDEWVEIKEEMNGKWDAGHLKDIAFEAFMKGFHFGYNY